MIPQPEVQQVEQNLSWIDIAVIGPGRCVMVMDASEGWHEFINNRYFEDVFAIDAPTHLETGAYRWSGFKIGTWDEDGYINISEGEFISHRAAAFEAGRAEGVREAAEVADAEAALRRGHMAVTKAAGMKKGARDFETMMIAHVQSATAIRALLKEPTK